MFSGHNGQFPTYKSVKCLQESAKKALQPSADAEEQRDKYEISHLKKLAVR